MKKATNTKQELRELMQHNRKMEQELEKVRMFRELQKMKEEQKQLLEFNAPEGSVSSSQTASLQIKEQTKQEKNMAKQRKIILKKLEEAQKLFQKSQKNAQKQPLKLPDSFTGNNLMDFLTMVGLSNYFQKFVDNDLETLSAIKNSKKEVLDSMGLSTQDQVKLFKKLRAMGIK